MYRHALIAFCLTLPLTAQAASLKEYELAQELAKVARESSVGTPRAINENLLDQGYTSSGAVLTNHLAVQPRHAAQMRDNPEAVREQMAASVCHNTGYRRLLTEGAVLRYEFTEYQSKRQVATLRFEAADCGL